MLTEREIDGQGAVRCHPHVLDEMAAVAAKDEAALGRALRDHGLHVLRNTGRALLGGGFRGQAPQGLRAETARISRLSAQFALTADLAMGLLGGQLKPLELLSARLGDILSALYLASACLWRYEMEAAASASNPAAALACLQAADKVIQVDDFEA